MCNVRAVRCPVYIPPSLTREPLLPLRDHNVEDDDQEAEDGHRIQPVLGSTDHATGCPATLVALSGLSCCGMIGVRTSVSLELLPLALSDLEIGSVGGV